MIPGHRLPHELEGDLLRGEHLPEPESTVLVVEGDLIPGEAQ